MTKIRVSVKTIGVIVLITLYMVIYCFWLSNIRLISVDNYATMLFPWIVAAFFVQLCCFVLIKRVSIFDFGLWFLLLSYLFMYGYLFITSLKLETSLLWAPIKQYDQNILFKSASFINLALNMFSIGYLMKYNDEKTEPLNIDKDNVYDELKFKIGIIVLIVGGICHLITSWQLISVTQSAGSYTAYTQAATSGIIDDIAFLFVPGVIYILTSKKFTGVGSTVFVGIVLSYFCVIMFLSGSRKNQIFSVVAIFMCYLYNYKPPKLRMYQKFLVLVGSAVFLNMIYVIRDARTNLSQMLDIFIESFVDLEFLNVLIPEVLAETGLTFCSVASVFLCVPATFPFQYGMTFIRAIISVLPIGWMFPEFFENATTTMTINKYMKLPVGDSILGDLYWNWGDSAIVVALLFGVILSVCTSKLKNAKFSEIYFSLFSIILMGVRTGVFELTRPIFIVLFVPWFIKCIFARRYKEC